MTDPITKNLPSYSKCKGVYIIFTITVLLIFLYALSFRVIHPDGNRIQLDPINQTVFEISDIGPISWWPLSHFFLFLILGILFPHCDFIVIMGGILWELFEALMSIFVNGGVHQKVKISGNVEYSYSWWAGSTKDIMFNIAGFYVGKTYRLLWEEYIGPLPFGCCSTDTTKKK